MASLRLECLSKRFGAVLALDDLTLDVEPGELLAVLGPSGSGKTTLLRLIAGHERPLGGRVLLDGRPVERLPAHRRDVGMVYQSYALFPHLDVLGNVEFGLRMRGVPRAERIRRAERAIALTRLDGLERRLPRQLSGGQQQRIALARALVIEPTVLLLDEPLAALDRKLRLDLRSELRQLQRELNVTTVYVTHDQEEALALADRLAILDRGRLQQHGTPRDLYERPASAFVADFVGLANLFAVVVERGADGQLVGRLDAQRIALPAWTEAVPGARLLLAVRPEHVRLHDQPVEGALAATLVRNTYLGAWSQLETALDDGTALVATRPNDGRAEAALTAGERVWIGWSPERVQVLRG
jgi:ABC-type Fe3+/spermidine/putrescine transport system ATPase subunit